MGRTGARCHGFGKRIVRVDGCVERPRSDWFGGIAVVGHLAASPWWGIWSVIDTLDDAHVAFCRIAQDSERCLVGWAVVRGDRLGEALKFDQHGAFIDAGFVRFRRATAGEEAPTGGADGRNSKLGVFLQCHGVGDRAIADYAVRFGHGCLNYLNADVAGHIVPILFHSCKRSEAHLFGLEIRASGLSSVITGLRCYSCFTSCAEKRAVVDARNEA
jgi:hypothetical protein